MWKSHLMIDTILHPINEYLRMEGLYANIHIVKRKIVLGI